MLRITLLVYFTSEKSGDISLLFPPLWRSLCANTQAESSNLSFLYVYEEIAIHEWVKLESDDESSFLRLPLLSVGSSNNTALYLSPED